VDLTIAPAGPADIQELLGLLTGQFQELEIAVSPERLRAGVDGPLRDPRLGSFLLARREGVAVAVAYLSFQWSLEHGGQSAWLEELYVQPEHRAGGIGRQLLLEACAHAAARGCAAVDLEVEDGHARAARLYAREGFRPHRRARWVRRLEG
jgi:GNAT superfamily N-acetyltransferase